MTTKAASLIDMHRQNLLTSNMRCERVQKDVLRGLPCSSSTVAGRLEHEPSEPPGSIARLQPLRRRSRRGWLRRPLRRSAIAHPLRVDRGETQWTAASGNARSFIVFMAAPLRRCSLRVG
jgi:hypothetical protein